MHKNIIFFLISISLIFNIGKKSYATDSLLLAQELQNLDATAESSQGTISPSIFERFNQIQVKAKSAGYFRLQADAINLECYYRLLNGHNDSIITKLAEAKKIYSDLNLISEVGSCEAKLGVAYLNLNRLSESLQASFKAKDIATRLGNKKLEAMTNTNIGLVYEDLEDWPNALEYAEKSLAYKKENRDTAGIAMAYSNIGNLYYYQGNNRQALQFMFEALGLNQYLKDSFNLSTTLANIGNIYEQMNLPDSAIYFLTQAFEIQNLYRESIPEQWCITVAGLAASWQRKSDLKNTVIYLNKCKDCEGVLHNFLYYSSLYKVQASYYNKIGDYKKANQYLNRAIEMQDSIRENTKNLENQKMAIQFEFNQRAREDSLSYQLKISQQKNTTTQYRNTMYLSFAIGVIVLASAILIISRLRISQKIKRNKELQQVRENIAGDLHDDLGSTLSSIQIMSSLMVSQSAENPKIKEAASNISRLSDKIAAGMREIVWSLNPAHDTLEAIVQQMHKIALDILATTNIQLAFKKNLSNKLYKLSPQSRKDLLLLFKESINNARKYSKASKITISIAQEKNKLMMKISDDGVGFELNKVSKGNGLDNIERRAKNLHGKIEIRANEGKGVSVELVFPLP